VEVIFPRSRMASAAAAAFSGVSLRGAQPRDPVTLFAWTARERR